MSARSPLLIALALTLALAPAAAAPTGAAVPDALTVDLVATSPGAIEAFVDQAWSTQRALRLRQSLDAFFGSADETLTPTELEKISAATETDMRNQKLGWLTVNTRPFIVQNATVTFGNATGRINDTRPLSMIHDLDLAAQDLVATDRAELRVEPFANGSLRFSPPPGWTVARTNGLDDVRADGAATLGAFRQGRPVTIEMASSSATPPTTSPTSGPANPTNQPTSSATPNPGTAPPAPQESLRDRAVPGIAPLAILAVGAALALLSRRSQR